MGRREPRPSAARRGEELTSILSMTGQMIGILTEQNVQASLALLKPTDIPILPELGDYSAADFDHMTQTIPIGEAAARKVAYLGAGVASNGSSSFYFFLGRP